MEVVENLGKMNLTDEDVPQRPTNSVIQLARRATGIQLIVPPRGFWKGAFGLFFFALLWNGFMGALTVMFFMPGTTRNVSVGIFLLIVSGFWLVGIGLFLAAINLARRRAELTVDGSRLSIFTAGIFGKKLREWPRNEITAIRVDASNMRVNDRPVPELQIHTLTGKKSGFLFGLKEAELRWVATELRQALKVPARGA